MSIDSRRMLSRKDIRYFLNFQVKRYFGEYIIGFVIYLNFPNLKLFFVTIVIGVN